MSFEEALAKRQPKKTAVEKLDDYIASLPERESAAALWMMKNETNRFCLQQLQDHGFASSLDTVTNWKRAHNVV